MTTDFLVDSFDPLHVCNGVLGVAPMFGYTTTHFVNECLQLILVSGHVVKIRVVSTIRYHTRCPPKIPVMFLRALLRSPILLLRAHNREIVMCPYTREIAQLSGTARPRNTQRQLRPGRNEPEHWWKPEMSQQA